MFKVIKSSTSSRARLGRLTTPHGSLQTPFFMPIATKGSVKAVTAAEMKQLGAQIILSNTYHLYLQPGLNVLKKFKGLHNFMNWPGPLLTDSGGYQVFSLSAKTRQGKKLRRLTAQGVEFHSFIDGSRHLFTPRKVQQIQDIIGSDIKMVLDVCSPYPCSKQQAKRDLELTHLWAEQALAYHLRTHRRRRQRSLLFGIVQGSIYHDLRAQSASFLSQLDFDGLAIGGLAVGEPVQKMYSVLENLLEHLPTNKPRYLMGVGKPENIIQSVKLGMDMFDCVIPTREARHGRLYKKLPSASLNKPHSFYRLVNINNARYKTSTQPLDKNCPCELCTNYSLGYLHHLFKAQEPLAIRLASLHNLQFYLDLMRLIRQQIKAGRF